MQMYKDRLGDLNTEKQAMLEILSPNWKGFQTQGGWIRQTIEKVLDKNTSLAERNRTLFGEQGITIFSILTALSMTISIIVLDITCAFAGGGGETGGSPPKRRADLDKMVRQTGKCTRKTRRKGR